MEANSSIDYQVRYTEVGGTPAGSFSSIRSDTPTVTTDGTYEFRCVTDFLLEIPLPSMILWSSLLRQPHHLLFLSGVSNTDYLTNDATVSVTLSANVASWEYSVDGGSNWSTGSGTSFELADDTTYAINDIQVRQTDNNGKLSATASNDVKIVTDMTALSAPTFALNTDSGSSNSDGITNDATVNVTLATGAASWEYSVDGGSNWSTGELGRAFELADDTTFAINDIQVRQLDTAGNTSAAAKNAAQIVTDMTALSAPTFALNADTGSSNSDGITNDATVNVTLANGAASWEFDGRRFELVYWQ